jgi:hypothetical protein
MGGTTGSVIDDLTRRQRQLAAESETNNPASRIVSPQTQLSACLK